MNGEGREVPRCKAAPTTRSSVSRTRGLSLGTLATDDAGRFELHSQNSKVQRRVSKFSYSQELGYLADRYLRARRRWVSHELDYLILVPTLRCNLTCSYFQVSRAAIGARNHDWSEETLLHVLGLVAKLKGTAAKIEFQGGEPTLPS